MYQEESIKKLHQATEKLAKRKSCWYGFLYGIALGLGATLGVTVISGVVVYILQKLQLLPLFESTKIQALIKLFQQNSPYLGK